MLPSATSEITLFLVVLISVLFSPSVSVIGSGVATVEFLAKNSPFFLAASVILASPGSDVLNLARARIGSMWFLDINVDGFSGDGRKWNSPSLYSNVPLPSASVTVSALSFQ